MATLDELLKHPGIWRAQAKSPSKSDSPTPSPIPSPTPLPAQSFAGLGEPASVTGVATGYPELDEWLPDGGWPVGGLTELFCHRQGWGTLSLLFPALAALTRQGRSVAWIGPPFIPYAPALHSNGMVLSQMIWIQSYAQSSNRSEELAWAAEQVLRTHQCGAVLLWWPRFSTAPASPHSRSSRYSSRSVQHLRRLQLAAETGGSSAFLFCSQAALVSPAKLKLRVELNRNTTSSPSGSLWELCIHVLKCYKRRSGMSFVVPVARETKP